MSREIDRKIAELMGCKCEYEPYGNNCPICGGTWIPEFHRDWNAMRLLVEWLQGKGLRVEIDTRPNTTYCTIFGQNEGVWDQLRIYRDDIPALALCKAVLSLDPEVLK
ncbi:hypothetical protein [Paenibacillus silvisoli]|uniref:hypothetical protein n=1 Tax=Paenibacillus silvisoli TaxID=3110539 RepID=UPI002803BEC9|nr:hypothetical protein [Paenibacillus silvisoli]